MTELIIERPTTTDIPSILKISEECKLSPWSRTDYLNELTRTDSIILVARDGAGGAVGFITGRLIPQSGPEQSCEAEIYNIGVTVSFRKLGVGTCLLRKFLEVCSKNEAAKVFLEVRASNDSALRLYGENGFEQIAVRKQFYRNPVEDGVVLRLRLPISLNSPNIRLNA